MAEDSDISGLAKRIQMRRVGQSLNKAQTTDKRQRQDYAATLVEHIRDNGSIVCFSDDQNFTRTLRELIVDTLKMPASSLIAPARAENMVKLARAAVDAKKTPLILVEQNLNGRDLSFAVRLLKTAYPEIKTVMLAREMDKSKFVLLHESGVDACLVKPLDGPALLEKIALAIKPNEQLDRSLEMAKNLAAKEEFMAAMQICAQALERQGSSPAILLQMGDIFKAMKEYDKAVDAYKRASGGSALYIEPLRKLADLYAEKGDTSKQIEYLEKMDELSPLNLDRKIQIGELSLKLNRPDKARKIFDQAMKLSNRQARENVSAVAYRVADLYVESDPVTAASFLQRGLDARKEFWGHEDLATFNRLGILLRRSGQWREACEAYLKALTVAPNDENITYNLSMAYLEGSDLEKARAYALKALALNPELPRRSSRVAANLGAVFMSTNDKMHALPLLRVALELDPENPEARELLARAEESK